MKKWLVKRHRFIAVTSIVVFVGFVGVLCWTALFPAQQETLTAVTQQPRSTASTEEKREFVAPGVSAPSLPFQLIGFEQVSEYWCADTLESWSLRSDESCADYALAILETLHAQGLELVQAGFMDLSGECWSCVFIGRNGESLSATLMPEHPFSPRSETNMLAVTVIHYLQEESFDER